MRPLLRHSSTAQKEERRCFIKLLNHLPGEEATLFRTPEEAAETASLGTQFQEWSKHWQVGEEVQDQDELRSKEEALPLLEVMCPGESCRRI